MAERIPRVLAIDAGGTMTDAFVVDEAGEFVVGKAQTTPDDESVGFMRSSEEVEGTPPTKGTRWQGSGGPQPVETDIYELGEVATGNSIQGPAIVESVATTFAIPPGRSARLDRHQIFHLSADDG